MNERLDKLERENEKNIACQHELDKAIKKLEQALTIIATSPLFQTITTHTKEIAELKEKPCMKIKKIFTNEEIQKIQAVLNLERENFKRIEKLEQLMDRVFVQHLNTIELHADSIVSDEIIKFEKEIVELKEKIESVDSFVQNQSDDKWEEIDELKEKIGKFDIGDFYNLKTMIEILNKKDTIEDNKRNIDRIENNYNKWIDEERRTTYGYIEEIAELKDWFLQYQRQQKVRLTELNNYFDKLQHDQMEIDDKNTLLESVLNDHIKSHLVLADIDESKEDIIERWKIAIKAQLKKLGGEKTPSKEALIEYTENNSETPNKLKLYEQLVYELKEEIPDYFKCAALEQALNKAMSEKSVPYKPLKELGGDKDTLTHGKITEFNKGYVKGLEESEEIIKRKNKLLAHYKSDSKPPSKNIEGISIETGEIVKIPKKDESTEDFDTNKPHTWKEWCEYWDAIEEPEGLYANSYLEEEMTEENPKIYKRISEEGIKEIYIKPIIIEFIEDTLVMTNAEMRKKWEARLKNEN